MSMYFQHSLWILGEVPSEIIQTLREDGWTVEQSGEMGVCLSLFGNYLTTDLPRFENHPRLLCVLSSTHEGSPDNHRLCVARYDDYVEGYFDDGGTVCEAVAISAEQQPLPRPKKVGWITEGF